MITIIFKKNRYIKTPHEMERNLMTNYRKTDVLITSVILIASVLCYVKFYPQSVFSAEERQKFIPDPKKPLPFSETRMEFFEKAAVVSDAAPCAKIGRDVLKKNGSAVDASIGALICNSVVNMQSAGVGGGFFMTIFKNDEKKVYCLNAREKAPSNMMSDKFMNDGDPVNNSVMIAIPGEIKGYLRAHQKFGKLRWEELVQPTIDICEKGYTIGQHQYNSMILNKDIQWDENLREWFSDNKTQFKRPGKKVVPTKLCNFLKMLSKNGPEDFYTGELSKLVLEDIVNTNSTISAEDLRSYDAVWMEPINITLNNGDQFYSFPAPGSGPLVSFILNVLDGYNFTKESRLMEEENVLRTYHRIIETFKFAFAKRPELGDPNFVDVREVTNKLLSKDFAKLVRLKVKDKTSHDPAYYGLRSNSINYDQGTSHISVIAENGDAVSVTSTINKQFGAAKTGKRTGFIFNNAMADFSFEFLKNNFDLIGADINKPEPRKTPLSSMSPSILTDKHDNVKLVIGGIGGPKIITSIAQTIMRLRWLNNNLKEAVDTPKVHHQLLPMTLVYEYGLIDELVQNLKALGHTTYRKTDSAVYALQRENDKIIGIHDSRKPGGGVYGI
ncbi:glutathione hydrolase 1 proenzyme-like [Diabrotica virgifera virgifera]|uniref:Glutathione hydrolase 1 proenzyme-like n=1 Tax=Diabrotica virgifera virgifera TaxID=50390 RepID=A0ABM5IR26_DIAVI|nr:glutathione hydrolase 1 proenzyme-like [Diabrotica virgifera virgifera]